MCDCPNTHGLDFMIPSDQENPSENRILVITAVVTNDLKVSRINNHLDITLSCKSPLTATI